MKTESSLARINVEIGQSYLIYILQDGNCKTSTFCIEFDMSKLKEAGFNPGLNSYGKIAFQIYDDSDIKQNFQKAINKIKKLNFDNSKSKQMIFILGLYEVIKQSFPTKGRGNLLTGTEGELRGLAMDYLIKSQINILGGKKNTFKDHTVLPKLKKLVTSDTKELFEGFYKFLKENKFENSDLFFFFENNLVKFIRGMLGVNNTIISRVKGQLDLLYEFTRHNGILVQSTQDGKRIDHFFANDYSSPFHIFWTNLDIIRYPISRG